MRMNFTKHEVISYMRSIEDENFELTKDLNVAETDLIEL